MTKETVDQARIEGKKILLLEDDEFITRVYKKWLSLRGAVVSNAHDGTTGMEILNKESFDLILLDLGMPGLDGYETLTLIRNDPRTKDVPVIILSNTTMTEDKEGFKEISDLGVSKMMRKYETSLQQLVDAVEVELTSSVNSNT
jgi:CheY-like chemotaxis protein